MDPILAQLMGYSAFTPPGATGLGRRMVPQLPVIRPPEAPVGDPLAAYGGQMGLGEMAGMAPTTEAPASSGPGFLGSLLNAITPSAPELMVPAAATPAVPPVPINPPEMVVPPTLPVPAMPQPTGVVPMPTPRPASLGAALEPGGGGVPMPRPRPTEAPGPQGAAPGESKLLETLRGVKAPDAPVAQKVGTPHAPALRPIQGGAYFDLLASLGIGPQQAMQGLKLPSTLGQALGGR